MVSANWSVQYLADVTMSLNPYYTGRWFLLWIQYCHPQNPKDVLILIILEDGFCWLRASIEDLF